MFDRVMEWLESDAPTSESNFGDEEVRVAVAALFYHVVAADGVVTDKERERLELLLSARYNLDEKQLERLTRVGQEMERSTAGVFTFTVILNRQLDVLERHRIFSQLQALAMSDERSRDAQNTMLQHIKRLLKLG